MQETLLDVLMDAKGHETFDDLLAGLWDKYVFWEAAAGRQHPGKDPVLHRWTRAQVLLKQEGPT